MRRRLTLLLLALTILSPLTIEVSLTGHPHKPSPTSPVEDDCRLLYEQMCAQSHVDYRAFKEAYEGYRAILSKSREVLTLIDFSLPSTEPRLYVFDMKRKKMLHKSVVAHGRNSGGNYATSFSNKPGSFQSSLGFYLTDATYQGKNGYSLRLKGLEKGINDLAEARAIVIHGAKYANPSTCRSGRLGRSLGCPALPEALNRPIIDAIKGGSVLYIYSGNEEYRAQSQMLRKDAEHRREGNVSAVEG